MLRPGEYALAMHPPVGLILLAEYDAADDDMVTIVHEAKGKRRCAES